MEAREFELKFELNGEMLKSVLEHPAFAEAGDAHVLRSVYFDTPSHKLSKAGLGLRVRHDGDQYVQTLKREDGSGPPSRTEWEAPVPDEQVDVRELASTPAARLLKGKRRRLEPVFETKVERTQRSWVKDQGVVEISLDKGEVVAGDASEQIFELELELKSGDPVAVFDLADSLERASPLRLSLESKSERGYRLADGSRTRPLTAENKNVDPDGTATDALRAAVQSCLKQIAANAALIEDVGSREALHQTRVGLRRLRAAFNAFKPLLAGPDIEELRHETKWLGRELDDARNLDVFIDETFRTFDPAAQDRPAFAEFGEILQARQNLAYQRAITAIGSPRFAALLLKIARWSSIGEWTATDNAVVAQERDRPVAAFATKQIRRLHRKVAKDVRRFEQLDDRGRHKLRIHSKKLRYAAEFFSRCLGKADARDRYLGELEALQQSLGAANDTVGARTIALAVAAQSAAPELHYVGGLLAGSRQAGQAERLDSVHKKLRRFTKLDPTWR